MSTLRVNKLVNLNDDGPVEFTTGLTVPSGQPVTGDLIINTSGIVTSTNLVISNDISVSGVVTASSFVGDGSNLTSVPGTSVSKGIAFTLIG